MFEGTYTAIVTPFDSTGAVDYATFRRLIDAQAEAGIDGIVPVGTTGESPTLNYDEHRKVIDVAIEACRGRMKVIAGTGANSTSEALLLTQHAKDAGADGSLQVTPYYNKPNQNGLMQHFSAVADLEIPIVLYNVPGRTALEISVETVAALADHPYIVAVKEAGGDVGRVSQILDRCNITVLSGDDPLTLPMMKAGAKGVVSVASNIVPKPIVEMVRLALDKNWDEAHVLHDKYCKLFNDMFIDTNPIPVKAAMAMMGLAEETYRLPLCPMSDDLKSELRKTLETYDLL